jgi:hypothetical protein
MHDTDVPGSGRCYKHPLPAQINACLLVCARSLILLKSVAIQISSSELWAHGVAVVVDVLVAVAVGEQFVYCSSTATLQRVGHADINQNKSGLECSRPPPSFAVGLALLLFPPTQIRINAHGSS